MQPRNDNASNGGQSKLNGQRGIAIKFQRLIIIIIATNSFSYYQILYQTINIIIISLATTSRIRSAVSFELMNEHKLREGEFKMKENIIT